MISTKKSLNIYLLTMQIIDLVFGIILMVSPLGYIGMNLLVSITIGFPIWETLLFILPIETFGLLLITASGLFKKAKNMADEELILARKSIFGWSIYSAIVFAPSIFGMIAIIIFANMANKYILDLETNSDLNTICENKNDINKNNKKSSNNANSSNKNTVNLNKTNMSNIKEQLIELKSWKDENILTEDEYLAMKKQILHIE